MNSRLFLLAMSGLFLAAPFTSSTFAALGTTDSDMTPSSTATVSSSNLMKDQEIKLDREVKQALMADKDIAPVMNKITLQENKGVVTLTGKVNSSDIKSRIENKIKILPGVVKVVNNLEVEK